MVLLGWDPMSVSTVPLCQLDTLPWGWRVPNSLSQSPGRCHAIWGMNLQDQNATQNQKTAPYSLWHHFFSPTYFTVPTLRYLLYQYTVPTLRHLLYQWGCITTDGEDLLSFHISHQRRHEKCHLSHSLICTMEQITGGLVPLTFNFSVTKVGRTWIGPKTGLVGLALVLTPPNDPQVGGRGYK